MLSALLDLCEGNPLVNRGLTARRDLMIFSLLVWARCWTSSRISGDLIVPFMWRQCNILTRTRKLSYVSNYLYSPKWISTMVLIIGLFRDELKWPSASYSLVFSNVLVHMNKRTLNDIQPNCTRPICVKIWYLKYMCNQIAWTLYTKIYGILYMYMNFPTMNYIQAISRWSRAI